MFLFNEHRVYVRHLRLLSLAARLYASERSPCFIQTGHKWFETHFKWLVELTN